MSEPTSAGGLGVYVHIPFCERVCPYCDFAVEGVGRLSSALAREFVASLGTELELQLAEQTELSGRPLDTLYLGGGTPGLLEPEHLGRLIEALTAAFGPLPREVTLELNPGVQEIERLPGYRSLGVTRLSVGVQSLDDRVLRRLGRAQSAAQARAGLQACLEAGFSSVSADLIYAAPDQSIEGLADDLETLTRAGVPHVSVYGLTLEPGTPLQRAAASGQLSLPDEDREADMFELVRRHLTQADRSQYEISSYALAGHGSQHNQRYWQRLDVLGLGPSASSLIGNRRFKNDPSRVEWSAGLQGRSLRRSEDQSLSARQEAQEALALGLRRIDGISLEAYEKRYGASPAELFGPQIDELLGLGLIAAEPEVLRLTEHGIRFADEVFLRFVGR